VAQYLLKRLGMTIAVVLAVMVFLASIVHILPGDPVTLVLGPRASQAAIDNVRMEMGLDEPILLQVGSFVLNALQGDLGRDFLTNRPVTGLIWEALPHTLLLALSALAVSVIFGIPLGVLSATKPDSWLDRVTSLISVAFITVPPYVMGLYLLLLFPLALGVLPVFGAGSFSDPVDYLRHLILPTLAIAIGWVGYLARLVRVSMLEVMQSSYIRVARAYGYRERRVHYRYALKNGIIPTVAILGVALGNLMGGAVFAEFIFSRPGLGTLALNAITNRNFPVLRGAVLTIAVVFVVANLLADLSYRFLDPRIRVEARSG
jgi:peptide/nickel transport system permease protein